MYKFCLRIAMQKLSTRIRSRSIKFMAAINTAAFKSFYAFVRRRRANKNICEKTISGLGCYNLLTVLGCNYFYRKVKNK